MSIGSTIPQQREIAVSVVEWADLIVCDVLDEVLESTGDMIAASAAGIEFHDKSASLTDLLSGTCADRLASARNMMFKSIGSGLQDIVGTTRSRRRKRSAMAGSTAEIWVSSMTRVTCRWSIAKRT